MNKDWLDKKFEVYLDPLYYEEILPPYTFHGKRDEQILEDYLREQTKKQGHKFRLALELGCGSGRGTKILKKYCEKIIAVDLNEKMLDLAKQRLKDDISIDFYHSEMFQFVKENHKIIKNADLVVSFWALNYSLNAEFAYRDPAKQIFKPNNPEEALKKCKDKLSELFGNISDNARFILFHYDPESEEQIIAHKCWEKIVPFPWNEKSPSLFVLKRFFEKQNEIDSCITKLNGINKLGNFDHALEIFMNFHLHTSFNHHPLKNEIMKTIKDSLKDFNQENIIIGAGTVIIFGEKVKCLKN